MQGAKEAKGISGSTISTKVESPNPAKRPKIPVEFGSKVPHNIRQKYLDRIIDEYTPKLQSLQEVYDKVTFYFYVCNHFHIQAVTSQRIIFLFSCQATACQFYGPMES